MVLILSVKDDYTTDLVIEYLESLKKKWLRINNEDNLYYSFTNSKPFIIHKGNKVLLENISSIWYRRNGLNFQFNNESEMFKEILYEEHFWFSDYFRFILSKKRKIGNHNAIHINKLIVLEMAKESGLLIPETIITDKFKELKNSKDQYITKTIAGNGSVQINRDIATYSYTELVEANDFKSDISLSFFQEYIEKKYELRIFFFNKRFWTMAIFSQFDHQTKIDYRKYNKSNPNRTVPFQLPNVVEKNLKKFISKLNINTGSIDMIVSKSDKFIFLEINPIGQIGMTSGPCNYNIEREIARFL